jgi:uncharacterized coiled-coil DUF342 family protein
MIRELLDKAKEAKVRRDCKAGKHRWANVYEKLDDGSRLDWMVCQTCGAETEKR